MFGETASRMSHHYNKPLSISVTDGKLVIEIGVNTLAHACSYSDWANPWSDDLYGYFRTFAIEDAEQFARDVRLAMTDEEEDGSTPLSDFLDAMSEAAINDGSTGLFDGDVQLASGKTHSSESWAKDE